MNCPYKVNDIVYIKKIRVGGHDMMPPILINKPFKVLEVTKIPLNNKELWDLELEHVPYCITSDDVSKHKPY